MCLLRTQPPAFCLQVLHFGSFLLGLVHESLVSLYELILVREIAFAVEHTEIGFLDKIPMGKEVLFRDEDVKRILFFMEV